MCEFKLRNWKKNKNQNRNPFPHRLSLILKSTIHRTRPHAYSLPTKLIQNVVESAVACCCCLLRLSFQRSLSLYLSLSRARLLCSILSVHCYDTIARMYAIYTKNGEYMHGWVSAQHRNTHTYAHACTHGLCLSSPLSLFPRPLQFSFYLSRSLALSSWLQLCSFSSGLTFGRSVRISVSPLGVLTRVRIAIHSEWSDQLECISMCRRFGLLGRSQRLWCDFCYYFFICFHAHCRRRRWRIFHFSVCEL